MAAPPYIGPGHAVTVRSQNTQGGKGTTIFAERQRAATASARGQAFVSTIQESGAAPNWGFAPVPGHPNLQQAVLPGGGRRGPVYAVHQTPPPGPSGAIPTRNGQLIISSLPIQSAHELRSPAVPATQRAAVAIRTTHGTFASQHAVSGVPALSTVQTQDHWAQMSAITLPGELMNLSGDFNHSQAASTVAAAGAVAAAAAAGLAPPPVPHVRRSPGATHQGGSNLDGFWTSSAGAGAATATTAMTGDHWGQQMMDTT